MTHEKGPSLPFHRESFTSIPPTTKRSNLPLPGSGLLNSENYLCTSPLAQARKFEFAERKLKVCTFLLYPIECVDQTSNSFSFRSRLGLSLGVDLV